MLIALQRLGVETIAVDRYDHAPGQQVAHHARTIAMSDPDQLRAPLLVLASNMQLAGEDREQFIQICQQQPTTEGMKKYGKRIHLMHMKDMQKGVKGDLTGHADVETNVTIGTGSIDYATIVREARKIGVKYLIIEDESSRSMTQVPASLKYLTSIK